MLKLNENKREKKERERLKWTFYGPKIIEDWDLFSVV
jgi:hypothetical protein